MYIIYRAMQCFNIVTWLEVCSTVRVSVVNQTRPPVLHPRREENKQKHYEYEI